MQNSKLIIYIKKNQTFFIFDFIILDTIMQINKIANAIIIIR